MPRNFSFRLRCPYGDHDTWITLEDRSESLDQLLHTPWDFECPAHGVQHELPLEGSEKRAVPSSAPPAVAVASPRPKEEKSRRRSSDRRPLHASVAVHGWAKSQGSFHEDTTTLLLNASGALVPLRTLVEVGEALFLVNKTTGQELEVRVVHVTPQSDGMNQVGLAFSEPSPNFWKKTRRNTRVPESFRVFVRGKDHNGNPYSQSSYTVDISPEGARLDSVGCLTELGQVIEVKRRWHGKARFRVIWIGQIGTEESNQVGICILENEKTPWQINVRESEPGEPAKPGTPRKPGA